MNTPWNDERYALVKELGRGGFGIVYLARDIRHERPVAIKVLQPQFTQDKSLLDRFEREARILTQLNHPAIVTTHEILRGNNGSVAIVQEFIDGRTLSDLLVHGPLPMEHASELCMQVADALRAAHSAKVVHRDLKPGNIMKTNDGYIKVLDFGLARPLDSRLHSSTDQTTLTQPGVIIGTPGYVAPEQFGLAKITPAVDVFTLGCIFFELLTGKKAFPLAGLAQGAYEANPLAAEPGRSLPSNVNELLRRMLERDAHRRTIDAAGVRDRLKTILRHDRDAMFDEDDIGLARSGRPPLIVIAETEPAPLVEWLPMANRRPAKYAGSSGIGSIAIKIKRPFLQKDSTKDRNLVHWRSGEIVIGDSAFAEVEILGLPKSDQLARTHYHQFILTPEVADKVDASQEEVRWRATIRCLGLWRLEKRVRDQSGFGFRDKFHIEIDEISTFLVCAVEEM